MKRYLVTGPAEAVHGLLAAITPDSDDLPNPWEHWAICTDEGSSEKCLLSTVRALRQAQADNPQTVLVLAFPAPLEPSQAVREAWGGEWWVAKTGICPSIWKVVAESPVGNTYETHNGHTWPDALAAALAGTACFNCGAWGSSVDPEAVHGLPHCGECTVDAGDCE